MGWVYEPFERMFREKAEREGDLQVLSMSSVELRRLIKDCLQDILILREEKERLEK
jgi:hypothetical protein